MEIKKWQEEVDQWIQTVGGGYFDVLTNMAVLAEETGEVARIIARKYGRQISKPDDKVEDLADELADVIWVATCLATQTGVDLEEALKHNLEKKRTRDAKRFLK